MLINDKAKLRYFLLQLRKALTHVGYDCPSCGAGHSRPQRRKYLVTTLRRCDSCRLLFRAPTTTEAENILLYNNKYEEGFTTTLPTATDLKAMMLDRFRGTEKNYEKYIQVLRALQVGQGAKVFDFGCSWGYGAWQLSEAGYQIHAWEISQKRAGFATEKLGIEIVSPEKAPSGAYDCFFSAHVIEHVPSVSRMLSTGLRLLRPGGIWLAFTPNGSEAYRALNPNWDRLWGLVHPQLLDDVYIRKNCGSHSYFVTSSPFELVRMGTWSNKSIDGNASGQELLFALRKANK